MPLRPNQKFSLLVASLVLALAVEGTLLWKLSSRPADVAPTPTPPPIFVPTPIEDVFVAPGTKPPTVTRSSPNPLGVGKPLAPLTPDARAQAKAFFDAAGVAMRAGDRKTALENYRRVVAVLPDHLPSRLNLALLYLQAKQPAAAIPHLQKAAQLNPKDAASRLNWRARFSLSSELVRP
jgi:hypothetical protein